MKEKLKQLALKRQADLKRFNELVSKADPSDEEVTEAETLCATLATSKGEMDKLQSLLDAAEAENKFAQTPVNPLQFPGAPSTDPTQRVAHVQSRIKVTSFKDGDGMKADDKAYCMGLLVLATAGKASEKGLAYLRERGMLVEAPASNEDGMIKLHLESINTSGGYLVPAQLDNDIIDLREVYGVARRLAKIAPMTTETLDRPRRTGGLQAYFVGEQDTTTESSKGWDNVNLVAKEAAVLAYYSNNLSDDAIIDIGNDLAEEIAYAFSVLEDDCYFNGDSTSPYGKILGILAKFQKLVTDVAGTWTTDTDKVKAAGVNLGSSSTWGGLTLADFSATKSLLPVYARTPRTRWVMHQGFYDGVVEKLLLAAGGITDQMIAMGARPGLLGFPIEVSQKMPAASAVSQIPCLFGDFTLGTMFGDRRQTTIRYSEHLRFKERQMAIQGTERFDINIHDIGNASATASLRVAGPIVALATKNTG